MKAPRSSSGAGGSLRVPYPCPRKMKRRRIDSLIVAEQKPSPARFLKMERVLLEKTVASSNKGVG